MIVFSLNRFIIFFLNPIIGQPNNYKQEQNCAVLDSDLDFEWNDLSCSISAIAVCRSKPSKCPSPKIEEGTTATISKDRKR